MVPALITSVVPVLVASITIFGYWLTSRNDRQKTLLEVDLLSKLPEDAITAAMCLRMVIDRRIQKWERSSQPQRDHLRRAVLGWFQAYLFLAVAFTGKYFVDPQGLHSNLSKADVKPILTIFVFGAIGFTLLASVESLLAITPPSWRVHKWLLSPHFRRRKVHETE